MTPTTLRALSHDLRESSRYIGQSWVADANACRPLAERLMRLAVHFQTLPDLARFDLFHRLSGNVRAGIDLAVTTPDMLRAYLVNAATEVDGVAEQVERAESSQPAATAGDQAQ